jgi:hypothetical protein
VNSVVILHPLGGRVELRSYVAGPAEIATVLVDII